jgi:predicted nucleic acid-binding protein
VIVLDSYAVLALLKGEPAAIQVQHLVEDEEDVFLTSLGVAEVLDHLVRLADAEEDEAVLDLAQLGLMTPAAVEADLGARAGLLRARHYHRKNRAVSLADCVAAETSRQLDCRLASADPHLLDMCCDERIDVIALPDSASRIWSP